jgi:indolepyruvate ferredoxin oxidoreductase beta subunit
MHIRSTSVAGFLLLRLLAGLRWWRPYTWRFREEQARIEKWIGAIANAARRDLVLANEIAACGQLVKGYGDTHRRAIRNFDLIATTYFGNISADAASVARAIAAARKAALTDPEGQALTEEIAKSPASIGQQGRFAAAAE